MLYSKLKGYITEDEILGINLVNETFDHLNAIINDKKLIKKIDKKFIPFVKKTRTWFSCNIQRRMLKTCSNIYSKSIHTVIIYFKSI